MYGCLLSYILLLSNMFVPALRITDEMLFKYILIIQC